MAVTVMSGERLTTGEAARRAGVDPSTIWRWMLSGQLPALLTPGGDRRIGSRNLETLLRPQAPDLDLVAAPQGVLAHWSAATLG